MKEQKAGTENMALRFRSPHNAHGTHRVLSVVLQKHIVSAAGLTPRAAVVVGGGKYHAHLSGQSAVHFKLMEVCKLSENCIPNGAVVFRRYLQQQISRFRF